MTAMGRFVCFDVETPNRYNDRMSAIGVTVVEGGDVVDEFYSLVDPETFFDGFNVRLTGITPAMAAEAPTFPELWDLKLRELFSEGVLVAHNATFDLSVLGKCLRHYDAPFRRLVPYACTVRMGRRFLPGMPNHKLSTMCDYLNIDLMHHNAGSDAHACAEILRTYIQLGADIGRFTGIYDLGSLSPLRG